MKGKPDFYERADGTVVMSFTFFRAMKHETILGLLKKPNLHQRARTKPVTPATVVTHVDTWI